MDVWKAALVWFGIALLAIINGFLREAVLRPRLGERYAHVASTLALAAIVLAVPFPLISWIAINTLAESWALGIGWLAATLSFEFLAGHYLFGNSWAKIFSDYKPGLGRVWILVPFCVAFGPPLAFVGIDAKWAVPYMISLVVGVAVLVMALAKPNVSRWMIIGMFVYAGFYNLWLGLTRPREYENFAELVLIPWYRDIILGPFSANAGAYIVTIAVAQILSAVLIAVGGQASLLGTLGVCAFLMGIAPFGVGSAFPFSILVSLAALIVHLSATFKPQAAR